MDEEEIEEFEPEEEESGEEEVSEDEGLEQEPEEGDPEPAPERPSGVSDEEWEALDPTAQKVLADWKREQDSLLHRTNEKLVNTQKEFEAKRQEHAQERQRLENLLDKAVNQDMPDAPDPDLLDPSSDSYNPEEYHRQQSRRARAEKQAEAAREKLKELEQESAQEQEEALRKFNEDRMEFLQKEFPEILDPTKGEEIQRSLIDYAGKFGYGPNELAYAKGQDFLLLEKARRYDEMQKKGQTVKERAPKKVSSSAPKSNKARTNDKLEKLHKKARESKRPEDYLRWMREKQRLEGAA